MYKEQLYKVYDNTGHFLAKFETFEQADGFRNLAHRPDWKIRKGRIYNKKVTEKMKNAVTFIQSMTEYHYDGDINNFSEVSSFIGCYLDYAKNIAEEVMSCGDIDMEYYD